MWQCLSQGGLWLNSIYNFDDIPNSLLSLFALSTSSTSWHELFPQWADATRNYIWTYYLVLVFITGNIFLMSIFSAIIISNYQYQWRIDSGQEFMTER